MIKKQIIGLPVVIFLWVMLAIGGESPNAEASPAISKKTAGKVEGFRLAFFGMTEKQVYRAIYKEFRISKKTVERQIHPVEKTVNLGILVADLLPQSGPARIYYVFGYKSRRLIQVNIIWGRPVTENPDAGQIVALANQLRDHFSGQGFRQKGLAVNQSIGKDSILVFRGTDDKGRMVLLLLVNPQKPDVPGNQEIVLKLSYIQQPDRPDIFTIGKGKF
ncbi:hypothetical protein MNBD_NITROSPINAE05-1188 [hydrothermal vent metagenome]|uniref:Uncharacterized protein n=1 Tax=hydrothermal vent metagenome TaxID=652676 RepID=A0A3B1D713_9ZZZZ